MKVVMRSATYTFDDFCSLVKEDQKADLIHGVIYMASPENTRANKLFVWLLGLINLYVEAKDLGDVFGSRVAFRLDNKNAPEPDIAFVRKRHRARVRFGRVDGPPDLAMEIVSPESVERDYQKKRAQYQQYRVPEYWIVDELEKRIIVLRLGATGAYREVRPRKGEFHSRALPGFWLRPEWLWQKPLPRTTKILDEILARQG